MRAPPTARNQISARFRAKDPLSLAAPGAGGGVGTAALLAPGLRLPSQSRPPSPALLPADPAPSIHRLPRVECCHAVPRPLPCRRVRNRASPRHAHAPPPRGCHGPPGSGRAGLRAGRNQPQGPSTATPQGWRTGRAGSRQVPGPQPGVGTRRGPPRSGQAGSGAGQAKGRVRVRVHPRAGAHGARVGRQGPGSRPGDGAAAGPEQPQP